MIPASGTSPVTSIAGDVLTVLRCKSGHASKLFSKSDKSPEAGKIGRFFDVDVEPVNGPRDMMRVIERLEKDPQAFVIRGEPIMGRRSVLRRSVGPSATFREPAVGRRWVCLDLDSIPTTEENPLVALTSILSAVPTLQDVTAVYQFSASQGIKAGLRAHVWYWLAEPRSVFHLHEWASSLPFGVDKSLFQTVQPHYTAAPIFTDGILDPFEGRSRTGILPGQLDSLYISPGDVEREMAYWENEIARLADTGDPRHPLVNRAAYSIGGWVGATVADRDEMFDRIYSACEQSGAFDMARLDDMKREINSGLDDGARHPRELSGWKSGLKLSKEGDIKPCPFNLLQTFRVHPSMADCLMYDVRSNEVILKKPPPWDRQAAVPRAMRDEDDIAAAGWLNQVGMSGAVGRVSEALSKVASESEYDYVKDWLDALPPWDGVPRLETWLVETTGCRDDIYHSEVGRRWLISMVARTYDPGCKHDVMIVLIGPQGAYKSTFLMKLSTGPARRAYSERLGDIQKSQDYIPTLMGPWLLEVAELSAFSKKETEAVKDFLSTSSDRARLSYGRRAVDLPRRCVIAGTSNTRQFLTDMTGNRRFWPVDVGRIDLKKLSEIREQLFSEALAQYLEGERWHLEGEAERIAEIEQTDHTREDPWEGRIRQYLGGPAGDVDFTPGAERAIRDEVTLDEILVTAIGKPIAQTTVIDSRRVGIILRRAGWEKVRIRRDGQLLYMYKRGKIDK